MHGFGYHDHQWMDITPLAAFHHWLWGRIYTDAYTVYIYDFVGNEKFGFKRVPYFMVSENAPGQIVFTTDGNLELTTELDGTTVGKKHPKTSRYAFANANGDKAELDITWTQILESRDIYSNSPANQAEAEALVKARGLNDMQKVIGGTKEQYDALHIQPTYLRFFAHGGLKLTLDGITTESTGTMIYEYSYMGLEDDRAGV